MSAEMDLKMAIDVFLYSLFISDALGFTFQYLKEATNPSSYWICDGVIHGDKAGEISNALYQKLDDYSVGDGRDIASILSSRKRTQYLIGTDDDLLRACGERPYRWIAITLKDEIASKNMKVQEDMQTALATASSVILRCERGTRCALLDVLFKQCNNVSVLILAHSSFSFVSPPFQHCHKLRLLELEYCTDDYTTQPEEEGDTMQRPQWICLHGLKVLRLSYTEWGEILSEEWSLPLMANLEELKVEGVWCWQFICQLERRLPNLKRLRIIRPVRQAESSTDISNSLIDKTKLEVLDLSGNKHMKQLPASLSKASRLQELVVDGCSGLGNIVLANNSSLKSFSFRDSLFRRPWDPAATGTSKVSLKGCTQLEKLMLHGLSSIAEIDLSGCAIKVLDLEAMELLYVKRLFLLGCEHLYIIRSNIYSLEFVCIDTRPGKLVRPSLELQPRGYSPMQIYAIVADARLARSLWDLAREKYIAYLYINITSSAAYGWPLQPEATRKELNEYKDQQQCIVPDLYGDVFKDELGDGPLIPRRAFPQPPCVQLMDSHIEIGDGSRKVQSEVEANDRSLGGLMTEHVESLHVHDAKARAATPRGNWSKLRWCRVERCPNLDVVFPYGSTEDNKLETIWASDLLKARCIWCKGAIWEQVRSRPSGYFASLRHLHLRSCPSIQYALPLWSPSFPSLETLHIIHCGDLRHVFEQDSEKRQGSVEFPKLTTIHLHDLPALQQICEDAVTVTAALETIKIRGCWSLRRLPALKGRKAGMKNPAVEVEKNVWDALKWDGVDAGHHPSLYEVPVHSRYYRQGRICSGEPSSGEHC